MSTEDDREKRREESPEWHRARANSLREHGFTKMAEEHEQIARSPAAVGAGEIASGCVRVAPERRAERQWPVQKLSCADCAAPPRVFCGR